MIERTTRCTLPGFESLAVTYNLLISERELVAIQTSMGQPVEARERMIVALAGWPGGQWGDDPFGPDAPVVVRTWLLYNGFYQALREFVASPKS